MARRPVKKRKPRKVANKVHKSRFDSRIPKGQRAARAAIAKPFKDPFHIAPDTIPDGAAFQWVTSNIEKYHTKSMLDQCSASGWKLVPGAATVGGLFLMWAPEEIAKAQRDANTALARQQLKEIRDLYGMDPPYSGEGRRCPLVSESFMASEPYQSVPSATPPVDVDITARFRLSARFQEAAALLKIAPEVYAQRRMELYLRGELGGILLPVDGALELFENGDFNIISRTK